MTASFSTESLRKPFTYIFKEPKWQSKILIYLGITLAAMFIPVLPGLIMMGYGYQIMHRVIVDDGEPVLPEWNDWSKLLADGWRLFSVTFIYALPLLIIQTITFCLYISFFLIMPLLAKTTNESITTLIPLIILLLIVICLILIPIFGIPLMFFLPPALCHTVEKESVRGGFEIKRWWKIFRVNFGGFIVAILFLLGCFTAFGIVIQILYMTQILWCLLPFVLIILTGFPSLVVHALFALVYREGKDKLVVQVG